MLLLAVVTVVSLFLLLVMAGWRANGAHWDNWFLNLLDGWVRLLCRRYHRLRFDPIPLPTTGAAIVVSNHISGLDPFILVTASARPLHFMIAKEEYQRFGLNWLFRLGECIPVDRDRNPKRAFLNALQALKEGRVVMVFPQGGIMHDKPHRRLKRGVAKLAELSGAPIYPAHIEGVAGAGHVLSAIVVRSHARLQSFPPLQCHTLGEAACMEQLERLLNTPIRKD